MHARAYVLIEAEAGQVGSVIAALRGLPGVTAADAVTGPYDIIMTIETPDPRDIGRLVMNELRQLDEVAYVRFASVYRRFQEATDFVQEVKKLGAKQ